MLRTLALILISTCFSGLYAQVEDIKVMQYNLMYYKASNAPCNHSRTSTQRDNDLKTIVSYVAPDILLVNELGSAAVNPLVMMADVLNVDGISHFNRAGSTNNSSSSLVNMLFYNKDKLALISQDKIELDINNAPLIRVIDFYHLYVKDPGLGSPGVDTVFFSVGLAHLKAGNSSSDATARDRATQAVMDYIDQLGEANVLFAGDFNVYSASQAAFQNLVNYSSKPSISLNDPENQLGSWNNNSNFATVHTQSTHSSSSGCFSGGGMDDRFDFILSSDAIMNNTDGLNFVNYRAIGQDGGFFNNSLSTNNNTSVPSSVASALYNFSDHLPVVLEMEASVSGIGLSDPALLTQSWFFANPSQNSIEIQLKNDLATENVELSLFSMGGSKIKSIYSYGSSELSLPCAKLAPGMYLLRLNSPLGMETRKVIIE